MIPEGSIYAGMVQIAQWERLRQLKSSHEVVRSIS